MKIEVEKIDNKLRKAIEGFYFEVGILDGSQHRQALPTSAGFKSFAGVSTRLSGRKGDKPMQELGSELQAKFKWLSKPFENEKNKELVLFAERYIKEALSGKQVNQKRLENLVQAIVRNPILRKEYGRNSLKAIMQKGFDHVMIDTGQFFNKIKAKAIKNVQI